MLLMSPIAQSAPNTMAIHPGLFFESKLGLIAAACHHCFVWFHYFCTEKPDLREIYGDRV